MKKIVLTAALVFCMSATAMAEDDVKISGSVEIQYRSSSDKYKRTGNDEIKAEELYIKIEKEVAENVYAMIKLDGADIDGGKQSSTHKYIEEAQAIFKNVAHAPLTIIFGKDEMPFGQDYEKFLISSRTHGFEIDKVWGLHGIYKIDGFGSTAAASFERAPAYDTASQKYVKPNTGLTDSIALKLKADKLIKNLSIEASYATIGKDDSVAAEENESRISIAGKYKMGNLGLHGEYTTFSDMGHVKGSDLAVIQVGADYKVDSWLLKARHEISDNNVDNDGSEVNRTVVGVSHYFSKKAFVALEWERVSYDGGGIDDLDELLLGAHFKY